MPAKQAICSKYNRNEKPPSLRAGVNRGEDRSSSVANVWQSSETRKLHPAFALKLLPGELARTAHGFGGFASFLDGGFLEMLLELHFAEHAFALELFLEGAKRLLNVIIADADLHVVVTTFLS